MAFKETILQEAMHLFKSKGIKGLSKQDILKALSISEATYDEYFKNKEDLLKQAIKEEQRLSVERDEMIAANAENAVIELLTMIDHGIEDLKSTSSKYLSDMVSHYPAALEMGLKHLESYSYHRIYGILNKGVQEGLFRKDMNMEIVTKVMLANINILLDQQNFPSGRYDLDEIYRCIYLYYVRGLCTEVALKHADKFFAEV